MNQGPHGPSPARSEAFLSGAYQRILRITIILSVAVTTSVTVSWGWRAGLAMTIGALIAYVNLLWLHHGTELAVERMSAPATGAPSRSRFMLAFAGRYVFVITAAYVILRSYPQTRVAFMVSLAFPIIAAMCEGVYEAVVIGKTDQRPD
ncbi:MAG TPA: ATP synthase subunit I [Candidatus Angelobacter sp.]